MSHQAFLEYIKAVGTAYIGAAKGEKTQILSHAKSVTGKDRKTLIRYLSRKTLELEQKRGFDGRGRPLVTFIFELIRVGLFQVFFVGFFELKEESLPFLR